MNLPSSSVAGASSRKTVSRDPSSRDSSAAAPGRSFRNPLDAWLAGQCGVQDADANALARALREARARALTRCLNHAAARSAFYARSLAGYDLDGFTPEDMRGLPFTTADDLARWEDFLCVSRGEVQRMVTLRTSGTTGSPKGVVYHHRGAHLNAVNNALSWELPKHPVYLWTLPMFHCNGWCFPWTLAATAGVSVCLRHVQAAAIYGALREHKVSHFCAAPIVLNMLNNADPALKQGLDHPVKAMTAGAAPPATVIAGMEAMGIAVTHVYGLTKTYGPCVVCEPQRRWQGQDATTLSRLKARQGVASPLQGEMRVINPVSGEPVPMDGKTLGEIVLRGNIVMKGYLKNPSASEEAMAQGWFRSGDLAVWHPDGYVEIKDRSKDIIISGGENISSLEVEDVLYRHPDVEEAAVIAMPDETWGEVPCAFVKLKEGRELTQAELIAFCREQMAHFKAPKHIIFTPLPKTSTGKVQKFMLRKQLA